MTDPTDLRQEASSCREAARDYRGRPEAPLLLRMAKAFEELASRLDESDRPRRDRP